MPAEDPSTPTAAWLDQICIEWIDRKRCGHTVSLDDYLSRFPGLADPQNLLDLIDADLCISAELGIESPAGRYIERFPELANAISQLEELQDSHAGDDPMTIFSVAHDSDGSRSHDFAWSDGLPGLPGLHELLRGFEGIAAPPWFERGQVVATGPGHWLMRGHDTQRSIPLAMKLAELPISIPGPVATELLDLCEAASRVEHPVWVPPMMATMHGNHFATLRAWHYATIVSENHWEPCGVFGILSAAAFAVANAHENTTTHGGIGRGNLLIDHQGQCRLVDAVNNRSALARYLISGASGIHLASFEDRCRMDIQDLVKFVSSIAFSYEDPIMDDLMSEVRRASQDLTTAAADIGSILVEFAETDAATGGSIGTRQNLWNRLVTFASGSSRRGK